MLVEPKVQLAPITDEDLVEVAGFLHRHLNSRVAVEDWYSAAAPSWRLEAPAPNHGFLLRQGPRIVGVYLAVYSERVVAGNTERFCNLAAWCVLEGQRAQGIRLLRALLAQPDYHFTDLSPSGNVVALNKRLKFESLDTSTALVPNIPWPLRSRGVRILTDPAAIQAALTGTALRIYLDHREAPAVRHLLLDVDGEVCHVMVRKDRRRNLPLFASILYVTDREVLRRGQKVLFRHLLLRHGALATLAELRIVGERPGSAWMLKSPRPKMYRSERLEADVIDNLYSELTLVSW